MDRKIGRETDGPHASPWSERDFRWKRVLKFMDEQGIDGILVFPSDRPGADRYLTNDRPGQTVVFPRHGKMVSLASSTQVVAQNLISRERREDTWIEDIRVRWTGSSIPQLVREKGLDGKRVGVVGLGGLAGNPIGLEGWIPYGTWASITEALPGTTFQEVTSEFVMLMLERSKNDIAYLRRAAQAGEEACRALMETARAGATELDIYSAGMCTFHKSGVNTEPVILTSGFDNFSWGRPMWLYRAQPPRILKEGDLVMVEMFPEYGGMEAQLQLAVAIGTVQPNHEICATAARKAYEVALDTIRPGAAFGEVCEAMEKPVREIGGWHLTPMIHTLNPLAFTSSVALNIETQVPEIARQYVDIRGRNRGGKDFELKPGMTFELEPNAHLGRYRVNIGGTVVVTEKGVEELNEISTSLQRVP